MELVLSVLEVAVLRKSISHPFPLSPHRLDSSIRYMSFFFLYGFQIFVSAVAVLGFSGGGFA